MWQRKQLEILMNAETVLFSWMCLRKFVIRQNHVFLANQEYGWKDLLVHLKLNKSDEKLIKFLVRNHSKREVHDLQIFQIFWFFKFIAHFWVNLFYNFWDIFGDGFLNLIKEHWFIFQQLNFKKVFKVNRKSF